MIFSIVFISVLIVFIITLIVFFRTAPQIGAKANGKRLERIQKSPRCKNGQFLNVIDTSLNMSPSVVMRTMYEMVKGDKNRVPRHAVRTVRFDRNKFDDLGNQGTAAISWFGHSSLLIKLHGKTFLTDPVLVGKRVSMLSFVGPERFPYTHYVELDELPVIDAMLLSHDHYDHLDYPTILSIKDRIKRFIVPLGVGAHLEKWGVPAAHIEEFDWWEEFAFDQNITLTCAPSRHFSGRGLTGRNTTLWCSWIISGKEQRLYFGADSGYSPSFKELGTKYGPFDLAILECGAYSKYWPAIHMMPEETFQASLDLNSRQLMPIHWGKFSLSLHGWKEPIMRLKQRAAGSGIPVITPKVGEIFEVNHSTKFADWWQEVDNQ